MYVCLHFYLFSLFSGSPCSPCHIQTHSPFSPALYVLKAEKGGIFKVFLGSEIVHLTSDGLGNLSGGDFADVWAKNILLMSMGG